MRIIHISVARDLGHGPRRQLTFEARAAATLIDHEWVTYAYQDNPANEPAVRQVPWICRCLFLRNIFFWLVILQASRRCDLVLARHLTFDPLCFLFAPLIPNRISVHHSKEVEELRIIRRDLRGKLASCLESFTGKFTARYALAFVGVTKEIADYQRYVRAQPSKRSLVYPNGVDELQITAVADERSSVDIEVVFISGNFADWHGLDKLFNAARCFTRSTGDHGLIIHLVGSLNRDHSRRVNQHSSGPVRFCVHGQLNESEYRKVFARCDLGFAALAMERQGLREGSTLKVRELLGCGIPVLSTHMDSALPPYFPFYRCSPCVDIAEVIAFGNHMKKYTREHVRSASIQYISKRHAMSTLLADLMYVARGQ